MEGNDFDNQVLMKNVTFATMGEKWIYIVISKPKRRQCNYK